MRLFIYYCLFLSLTSCHKNKLNKLYEARTHYILSNYKEANELYEELYNEKWNNYVIIELAQTAFKAGEYPKAIRLYKSAISINKNKAFISELYYNIGVCYTANNQKYEATMHYKKSIKIHPTKAAKHNLLLLKQMEDQNKKNKVENRSLPKDKTTLNSQKISQNKSNLKEIKIDKTLDELNRMDVQSKKNAYSKMKPSNRITDKKDW